MLASAMYPGSSNPVKGKRIIYWLSPCPSSPDMLTYLISKRSYYIELESRAVLSE